MCIPYTRVNHKKWQILSGLEEQTFRADLIHTISAECVLMMIDGKLHFQGSWDGRLFSTTHLKKFDKYKICRIASGTYHAAMLTNNGSVALVATSDDYGQFGGAYPELNPKEVATLDIIIPEPIVDICCGKYFTIALDNQNKVWFWGTLYDGDRIHNKPVCLNLKNIVKIAADANRFAVLDQSGTAHWWSSFSNSIPIPAPDSVVFDQIVCCFGYLYILTKEHTLYKYREKLEKIGLNFQINYIASNTEMLAASSTVGEFFFLNDSNSTFQKMGLTTNNILECFFNSKMPGVYKPGEEVNVSEQDNTLTENIARLYNKQNFSDVDIILSTITIHAHKCILAARSEFFNRKLTSIESNELRFSNANSNVMKSYVIYIYTGNLPEIDNFGHLLELYYMAKDDPNKLSDYCIKRGKRLINEENALTNYKDSAEFNNIKHKRECAEFVECIAQIADRKPSLSTEEVHQLFNRFVGEDATNTSERSDLIPWAGISSFADQQESQLRRKFQFSGGLKKYWLILILIFCLFCTLFLIYTVEKIRSLFFDDVYHIMKITVTSLFAMLFAIYMKN